MGSMIVKMKYVDGWNWGDGHALDQHFILQAREPYGPKWCMHTVIPWTDWSKRKYPRERVLIEIELKQNAAKQAIEDGAHPSEIDGMVKVAEGATIPVTWEPDIPNITRQPPPTGG